MKRIVASALYSNEDPFHMHESLSVKHPEELTKENILLLHGGADISPSLYKEKANSFCYASNKLSERDRLEVALVAQALALNLPIIGICRGAQLLCAMDGGTLIQHVVGHAEYGGHIIQDTLTKKYYRANSAHHQMMQPLADRGNQILAICPEPLVGYGENNQPKKYASCPEIVYFPHMRGIGIQGHPEWMPHSEFTLYCAELINKYILKD